LNSKILQHHINHNTSHGHYHNFSWPFNDGISIAGYMGSNGAISERRFEEEPEGIDSDVIKILFLYLPGISEENRKSISHNKQYPSTDSK
jgi:hypothetical protein